MKGILVSRIREIRSARWGVAALSLLLWMCVATAAHAEQFDRTVPVARGARLQVRLFGGEVVVRTWEREAVRVRATHFRTDTIDVQAEGQMIRLGARSSQSVPHAIDFDIDVPAWMGIDIKGTFLDITVDGTRGDVTAETVRGDVKVIGGAGAISLKSVEGEIVLEGSEGRASLSAANNGIRVTRFTGDLVADNVSGTVKLQAVAAAAVEVSTVSGDISWDGAMMAKGRYQFVTHSGAVDVMLAEPVDVNVSVRPFGGHFRATFPLKLPAEAAAGKRFNVVLGKGGARLDLETFSGTISLRRGGT